MAVRNFDREIKDLNGQAVIEDGKAVYLKTVVLNALLCRLDEDQSLSSSERIGLFSLATRVNEGGDREYTIKELDTIDQRVLKIASTLGYARVHAEVEREAEAPTS